MKRLILSITLAILLALIPASAVLADTTQDVEITATPTYLCIANAPGTWFVGCIGADEATKIAPDTLYYSNPTSATTTPTVGGATDEECRFSITNTSSVNINLTVIFPDMTGGDASTNSNLGTNDTTKFGAKSYFSGQASGAWVIAKSADSTTGWTSTSPGDNIKWGLIYESQSDAWTSGTAMSATVTIIATAD